MAKLIVCSQKRVDCVMNKSGKCLALTDTTFNRPCPFYKNIRMLSKQLEEIAERSGEVNEDA